MAVKYSKNFTPNEIYFNMVDRGDVFRYDGRIYIKTNEVNHEGCFEYNAVCLEDGYFEGIALTQLVELYGDDLYLDGSKFYNLED